MRFPRWLRRTAIALTSVIAAAGAAFLFLQTGPGRALVASLIESALSSDGMTVRVDGLEGTLPGSPRVAKLTMSDAQGPFLVAEGVRVRWRPFALIGGSIRIDDARIARVTWLRQPMPAQTETTGDTNIPSIAIGRLRVETATLAREVAGAPGTFAIDAALDALDPEQRAQLALRVTGTGGAKLNADFLYEPDARALNLDAEVEDRAGGALASLIGLSADAPLAVKLTSDGDLDNWRAQLNATGGPQLRATGAATIVRQSDWRRLSLSLDSQIGAIGPARWRPLIEGATSVELQAERSDAGAIRIDRLNASSPALRLEGAGSFDPAAKRAEGQATLVANEGRRLAPVLGAGVDWRTLTATVRLQGDWPTPTLLIDARAADAVVQGIKSAVFTAHVELTPDRRWDAEGVRVALGARADATGVTSRDPTLRDILGPSIGLSGNATAVDFSVLEDIAGELSTAGGTLRFVGDANAARVDGVVSVDAPDLARAGMRKGSLSLRTQVEADLEAKTWTIEGTGAAENVATGGTLDGLLTGKQEFTFAAAGDTFDKARISSVALSGPHVSATASGDVAPGGLDVSARVVVADLAALSPEHKGKAEADVHFSGTMDALRFSGDASVTNGRLFARPVKNLALMLSEPDDRGLSHLKIAGDFAAKPVEGAADVLWRADGVQLSALRLVFASVGLDGAATVASDGLIRGAFGVKVGDLADVGPFIDEDIGGAVSGRVQLEAVGARQELTTALTLPLFRIDDVHIFDVVANGRLSDVFAKLSLDVTMRAGAASFDGFDLENLTAAGKGPITAVAVTTRAMRADTQVDGVALMKLNRPVTIALNTFRLTRGDKTAALTAPILIAIGNRRVMIPSARIAAGGGSLTVAGDAGRATSLDLRADRAPAWLAAFVTEPLPVSGTVTGAAHVGEHGFTTFDVKVANLAPEDDPRLLRNLTLAATGKTDRTGVDFNVTLSDPYRTWFRALGRVPFAESGPLTIDAQGRADLALANVYLSVTGDRAGGTLNVSALVTGTLGAPRIEGKGKIEGGFLRSAAVGFEVRDIAAELTGSERRIAVTSLSGKTPNGGAITGRGEIRLEPANGYPVDIHVKAANAQLVATQITTVTADVDARMTGGLFTDSKISGAADIALWEIRLPNRLARPLTPIRVVHKNAPEDIVSQLSAYEEKPETAIAFGLDVDVRAPRRVFVRGHGVEAEFGGEGKVTGTVDDPIVNGRFDLRRGSVSLLSRRVELTRGVVSFVNDVEPTLDIAGEMRRDNVIATISLKGKVSAPVVALSSTPELPQDEILARMLFSKPTQQLSGLEAAQLGAAVAGWTTSGPSIFEQLRSALGIDALSSVTDRSGGSAVGAGNYVGSGVYFGFVQGTDTKSGRATVDIDLTDSVKLRGEVSPSGDNRLGVAAEWEY